jgi:2',3'-cyclic-nucleotide 2'-phosphodiesterase (5'-nucleotidase family)
MTARLTRRQLLAATAALPALLAACAAGGSATGRGVPATPALASATGAPPTPAARPEARPSPATPGSGSTARPTPAAHSEVRVTIFHETHTHGALVGADRQSTAGPVPSNGVTFAHYVGLIGQLRAALLPPAHSLFLGNGDDLEMELPIPARAGGGRVLTGGRHVVEAFNAAGLAADALGVSELGLPDARLRELIGLSRFPWVSANARDGADPREVLAREAGARRWAIVEVGGVRFGITGLVTRDVRPGDGQHARMVAPRVALLDPVEAMREVLPLMRAEGAQVAVVLSHLAYEETERVAAEVGGVDVALGSHVGPKSFGYLAEPRVVNGAVLSVAQDNMAGLGQLELTIRDGAVVEHTFRRHVPSSATPPDPVIQAVLDRYVAGR